VRAPRQTPTLDRFLAVRLATAGGAARRELDRACRARGRPLHEVLVLVAASDASLRPSVLADRLGLQRSEISRTIYALAADGWLDVAPHMLDGRSLQARALPGGRRVAEASTEALEAVDRCLRRALTPLRQRQLTQSLEALKGHRSPVADALTGI
jgi:DNA-binding MarR family transcriptional regulator